MWAQDPDDTLFITISALQDTDKQYITPELRANMLHTQPKHAQLQSSVSSINTFRKPNEKEIQIMLCLIAINKQYYIYIYTLIHKQTLLVMHQNYLFHQNNPNYSLFNNQHSDGMYKTFNAEIEYF